MLKVFIFSQLLEKTLDLRFKATALAAMICLAGAAAWGDTSDTISTNDNTTTSAAVEAAQTLGLNPSGFIQLPNQWSLKPAGKSLPLGDFPAAVVASPDRKYAAVLHCGFSQHEVRIMDVEHEKEISSAPQKNMWIGAAWSPDGKTLYVSGGANDVLIKYPVNKGKLGPGQRIELPVTHDTYDVPADKLAPQMAVDHVQSNQRKRPRFPAGMAMDPNGKTIYLAEMYANRIVQVDLPDSKDNTAKAHVRVLATFEENSNPYRVALDDKHKILYVSLWGSSAVAAYNLANGEVYRIPTDPHPNEMVFSKKRDRLFVSCANTNCVNVIDPKFRQLTEKLNTALYPDAPEGSTPNSLTVTADGDTLVVANADNNNLVLYDIEDRDQSIPQGFIPTGWYPTGVVTGPKDKLLAVCGKGNGSLANPVGGPVPGIVENNADKYIGRLLPGSAEFIPFPDEEELEEYSAIARQCSPLQKDQEVVGREDAGTSNPIPTALGQASPIKYVVYIIKETAPTTRSSAI